MNSTSEFSIARILETLYRLKELIIVTFIVIASLAVYLALVLPDVYRSDAVILVSPQRLPASFVTSTVTMDLQERLQSIVQEILSATQLEKIINEFNLYRSNSTVVNMTDRINRLRKAIKVDVRQSNTRDAMSMTVFKLSFELEDRKKVREVVRRITSLFINQNMQVRAEQAVGTKAFMNEEADRLRRELEQQEAVVNKYKAAHLFELPDQLDTNLRTLEQVRRELQANNQRLSTLQERKGVLQRQMVESDAFGTEPATGGQLGLNGDVTTQAVQLQVKKKELDSLLQRYSAKHPDVIRLRKEIEDLETTGQERIGEPQNKPRPFVANPVKQVLQKQIVEIDAEVQAVRSQGESLRSQINDLQVRVNNAPARAIELSKVTRGYEITLKKYQDLLAKSLESELSENMEKNQKGEQFRILDAPSLPQAPIRPKRLMIILIGLLGGLAGGCGLALLWDNLDSSFKTSDELVAFINMPVLATIPALMTRGSVIERRRAQSALVLASVGALVVGAVFVRIFAPMYF